MRYVGTHTLAQGLFLFFVVISLTACRAYFSENDPAHSSSDPAAITGGGGSNSGDQSEGGASRTPDEPGPPIAAPPIVTQVLPPAGTTSGGTAVVISGSGFRSGASVSFGGQSCMPAFVISANQITCNTPSHPVGLVEVSVSNSDNQRGALVDGYYFSAAEISSWTFVDGGNATGLNRDVTQEAKHSELAVLNSKLYAIWQEDSDASGYLRVRAAVYNGNDSSPAWSFIDGNPNGINRATQTAAFDPYLITFQGKLYAAWAEGMPQHIRVAVYGGNDAAPTWAFVDGNQVSRGLNRQQTGMRWAFEPHLAEHDGKLYATWQEWNGSSYQVRVARYGGNDSSPSWTFIDGNALTTGLNESSSNSAERPRLISFSAKLYLAFDEIDGAIQRVHVRVFNGNESAPAWTLVDGNGSNGVNRDPNASAFLPNFSVFNSKLYLTWYERNSWDQIRVAVYNGSDTSPQWTFVDGDTENGINFNPSAGGYSPELSVMNNKLYATWWEGNSPTVMHIRVAVYNGNDSAPAWSFVDGPGSSGINRDGSQRAEKPKLKSLNSKLYAIWQEFSNGVLQIRVAVGR